MKTITANIPARTLKGQTKTFSYPARTNTFTQDDNGQWSSAGAGLMTEAEVIDVCQRATNWSTIKAAHFPMHGFSN